MYHIEDPIGLVSGVGEKYQKLLQKLDIYTIKDLLLHIPFRYEDWSQQSSIQDLQIDSKVTISAQIHSIELIHTKTNKKIIKATVQDQSNQLTIIWYNQIYLLKTLKPGTHVNLSGKVSYFGNKIALISPQYELIHPNSDAQTHTGRLIGIYPETAGISSKWLRAKIKYLLPKTTFADWQTEQINQIIPTLQHDLSLNDAINLIHFPNNYDDISKSQLRLARDELISMHLSALQRRSQWHNRQPSPKISHTKKILNRFTNSLPFKLTDSQNQAISQLSTKINQDIALNCLLHGDVGSGKTVVSASCIYLTSMAGYQTAFMAPTEILAQQHYSTLKTLLEPHNIKVALQTGSSKYVKPNQDLPFDVLVGTHALLSDIVNFDKLGLIIIDEQHRFGVEQRSKLISKANNNYSPHILSMTATPIPRTITLTLYGDLDVISLTDLPRGRQPIKTWVVPETKRASSYEWIKTQIDNLNSQIFIICPFIEPSESQQSIKSAIKEYELLKSIFPNHRLELLHGKLKSSQKNLILTQFQQHQIDILVTTPVVEVGVDIPGATIIVIEASERFGLAQLHQLRGRVGRNNKPSYCLLFTNTNHSTRLQAMESINNGLELAELDLKLRGPGDLYGTAQHGFSEFKFADPNNLELINKTHQIASILFSNKHLIPDTLNILLQMRKIHQVINN